MLSTIREKVKQFLIDMLEIKKFEGDVKVIGIIKSDGNWIAEAEVIERDRSLPGHRVFEKRCYVVKLTSDFEVFSFEQEKDSGERLDRED